MAASSRNGVRCAVGSGPSGLLKAENLISKYFHLLTARIFPKMGRAMKNLLAVRSQIHPQILEWLFHGSFFEKHRGVYEPEENRERPHSSRHWHCPDRQQ